MPAYGNFSAHSYRLYDEPCLRQAIFDSCHSGTLLDLDHYAGATLARRRSHCPSFTARLPCLTHGPQQTLSAIVPIHPCPPCESAGHCQKKSYSASGHRPGPAFVTSLAYTSTSGGSRGGRGRGVPVPRMPAPVPNCRPLIRLRRAWRSSPNQRSHPASKTERRRLGRPIPHRDQRA
jgi:hypothetical protein